MCQIFASISPDKYDYQSRSIRIQGHVTSIRLESMFWQILEEIAESQQMSLAQFLTQLYQEVLALHGEVYNFASLLRCGCINYLNHIKGNTDAITQLSREARSKSIKLSQPTEQASINPQSPLVS